MRRMILWIMILALLLLAIAPALADSRPAPTPEPLYIVLQPGQTAYMLCATGMHTEQYGKEAAAGVCHASPTQ